MFILSTILNTREILGWMLLCNSSLWFVLQQKHCWAAL